MAFYNENFTAVRQHRLCANITNPLADLHINLAFFSERLLYRVALLVEKRQRFEIDYIVALSGVAFG